MRSAPAIAFDYRPSRVLGVLGALVGLLAVAAPWASGLGTPLRVLVSLAALVLATSAIRRHARPRFRCVACREGEWFLLDRGGDEHPAELVAQTRIGVMLALDFAVGRSRARMVLLPDNLDADTRRRLILLLARTPATAADPGRL
jgi:hypothetical protein